VVLLSDEEPETDETLKVLLSDSDGSWFKPASTAGKSEPGYTGDFDIHVWNLWQTQRRDAQSWQLVTPNHYFWCSIWCSAAAARRSLLSVPSWHAYERTVNISSLPRLYANLYQYPQRQAGLAGIQTPDYGWRSPAVGINL